MKKTVSRLKPSAARKARARAIVNVLKKIFPHPKIALRYKTPWELVVAVQLSAQCTDKKVNEITPALFRRYKTLRAYTKANPREFQKYIFQAGFFRAKTRNILAAAKVVHDRYGGVLPKTVEEMIRIPGIGRKSANVILGNAYGVVEGIAVDTHVRRLCWKLGLTDHKDPKRIEQDLMALLPKKEWFLFTYRIIEYGRQTCPARKHDCAGHPLTKIYPPAANRWISKQ
jgi:endonuclease-3